MRLSETKMPGPRMNNDIENVGLCGTKMSQIDQYI